MLKLRKPLCIGLLAGFLFALNIGQDLLTTKISAASNGQSVPSFAVDPFWPQPLPNKWILGRTIGVDVDERDHVFIVHRDSDDMFMSQEIGLDLGNSQCCTAAPPILEFDAEGNLFSSWGGSS